MIRWLAVTALTLPALLTAQTGPGPYARIAVLRPHDGQTVEFEAGYARHLEWHRQASDPWTWYGWSVWAGDRHRWFIYATFGHSAASLDSAVAPTDDERDNVANVAPHVEYVSNTLYEFLPALSRGSSAPRAAPRLELMTVDLESNGGRAFEQALAERQSTLRGEILWYRLVAGGATPRYVRLRPQPNLAALLADSGAAPLPDAASRLVTRTTIEVLTLRPTLSLGLR